MMWFFRARRLLSMLIPSLVVGCLTASPALAQEDDEESPYRPGLVATYTSRQSSATRLDETIAFDWQGAACDPRLAPGPFIATWRGRLWARGSGTYRLACYVHGKLSIAVAGKTILAADAAEPKWLLAEPLVLEFDHHPLEVNYERIQPTGQLALFWSGPEFQLEPIPARALMHDRDQTPPTQFERGRQLAAALRCGACHTGDSSPATPAPALDRLTGHIHESWLTHWLSPETNSDGKAARRMPDLGMNRDQASAIAAWLLREPAAGVSTRVNEQKETKGTKKTESGKKSKAKKGEEKPPPSAEQGERVLLTRGCLACHNLGSLGESGLFGGGNLSGIVTKRPAGFVARWLADPGAINRSHRMPVFSLTSDELESVRLWEEQQWRLTSPRAPISLQEDERRSLVRQGEELVSTFRCTNCHLTTRNANELARPSQRALTAESNWSRSCLNAPNIERKQPGYRLEDTDQSALREYYSNARPGEEKLSPQARGRDLLAELNCLACHQREGIDRQVVGTLRVPSIPVTALPSLQEKLTAVAAQHDDLAPLIPAMTPPALNSVGDKLHDAALADSISRQGPPHRPYLLVQMPKFRLNEQQLSSLTAYFTATDRILDSSPHAPREESLTRSVTPTIAALLAAGPRLVTTDGLACTSCHQVGSIPPAKAPLNARGPDLSMLERRIRKPWFDRWCADPARIVPRMEMPSVKVPVRGVLNDNVKDQLESVWLTLNTPGFEPPEPNPVRVLRLSGVPEKSERPIVIHDVVKDGEKTYLYPLIIGLPNRHNILFDLETNRLAAWWLGDTARQRTKGKSWYWEMGAKSMPVDRSPEFGPKLVLREKELVPTRPSQFVEPRVLSGGEAVSFKYELNYPAIDDHGSPSFVHATDFYLPRVNTERGDGFDRLLGLSETPFGSELRFQLVDAALADQCRWEDETRTLYLPGPGEPTIRVVGPSETLWEGNGSLLVPGTPGSKAKNYAAAWLNLEYRSKLLVDRFLSPLQQSPAIAIADVEIAPGIGGRRLSLLPDIMPTGIAWDAHNRLLFCTLKGEVCAAADSDGDGLEDQSMTVIDGLPTPYGLISHEPVEPQLADQELHVITKTSLQRVLFGKVLGDFQPLVGSLSSGWGATDDYHDWAVGLIRGENGEYYIALPCQQDQRSEAAANLRGKLLKLVPRKKTKDNLDLYDIEVVSAGHRFPMGMARNRDGELFVTDNQGNYNPFNELNHVRKGAHFGFINALEKQAGFEPPPLTEPAINIPHPWTRSVNGICFLDTPSRVGSAHQSPAADEKVGTAHPPSTSLYGPLEGHLVGCEYDTRRLIRMSLQKIGDTYQGAAYPLSIPTEDVEKGLLGPIVCAIKPTTGELYVGEIRDSGWGASNNIGQIVKIKIEPEKLPCGIAEVRAISTGFTIDFFQPVDRAKAADPASYTIQSYRRESTPAYGGPDLDRRTERIAHIELSQDGKRATLKLAELRPRHVYELKLKNLAPENATFHPDEAHYTLNQIPQ
jgi:mono/diheme cytochrome c family protein